MNTRKTRVSLLGLNYFPETTGNAPYTTSLAEGLNAAGYDVTVITGYPHYPEWELREGYAGWTRPEDINGVRVVRLRHYIPRSPGPLRRLHMELSFGLRLLVSRWFSPDVVILVSPALFSSGLALLRVRMSRIQPGVGIWVQDLYSRGLIETKTSGGLVARLTAAIESRILSSTDGIVAIHERFKAYMVNGLGVRDTKISVIRNWTHLPPSPDVDRVKVRKRMGWGSDQIIVLHSGNMGKKQGLENVLEAARLAQQSQSKVRFVLMGDGNQRRSLESKGAGLTHLQFIPPLPSEEFMAALACADVLLVNELPGVSDMAVPSKLTSYFNSGVAVVAATDEGSVTALEVKTAGAGLRVNAGDPAALVEAAEELGSDLARARAFGASGLQFRNDTLSEWAAIGHYDEFISSLASPRGS